MFSNSQNKMYSSIEENKGSLLKFRTLPLTKTEKLAAHTEAMHTAEFINDMTGVLSVLMSPKLLHLLLWRS